VCRLQTSQLLTIHADWSTYGVSAVYVEQPMPSFQSRYVITNSDSTNAFLADLNGVALADAQYVSLNGSDFIIYTSAQSYLATFGHSAAFIGLSVARPAVYAAVFDRYSYAVSESSPKSWNSFFNALNTYFRWYPSTQTVWLPWYLLTGTDFC
jgi:hypothetical protein